jgi:hypothetical protein
MTRWFRYFLPGVTTALVCLLALAWVGTMLYLVHVRHQARAEAQEACGALARATLRRQPWKENTVRLADACLFARRLRGDEP